VDIHNGTVITTLASGFSFSPRSPETGTGEVDIYGRVDVNSSTHTAIISGEGGFLLVNLVDHTTRSYQPEGVTAMWAVGEDQYRKPPFSARTGNIPILSPLKWAYWRSSFPTRSPRLSPHPAESPQEATVRSSPSQGKKFITASGVFMDNKPSPPLH